MGQRSTSRKHAGFTLLQPIRQSRNFRALWIGQSFSNIGDSLLFVYLPLLVYEQTKSTILMGILMMILTIPQLILLPISGILADRLPKVRIMITSDLVRMLLVLLLLVGLWQHFIGFWTLAVFQFLTGTMDSLFMPSYSALQAEIYTSDIRNAANSLTQFTRQGSRLLGPVLGGMIATLVSGKLNLTVDAITFLISVVSLFLLKVPIKQSVREHDKNSAWTDFTSAVTMISKVPWLWISMLATLILSVSYAGFDAILLPWLIKVHHHYGAYVYGFVVAGNGVGMLLSSLVVGLRSQWHKRGILAYGSLIMTGISIILISFSQNWFLITVLAFISGFSVMFYNILWQTTMQEIVPTEQFGRVSSLEMLLSLCLLPVGYVVIGWAASAVDGNMIVIVCGALIVLTAIAVLCIKKIRRFN